MQQDTAPQVETRKVTLQSGILVDVTQSICDSPQRKPVLVVADRPKVDLMVLRKRWFSLQRAFELERASTLDHGKRKELADKISFMKGARLAANAPHPETIPEADVYVLDLPQAGTVVQHCNTVYLATSATTTKLEALLQVVRRDAHVVRYQVVPKPAAGSQYYTRPFMSAKSR